MSIDSEVICEIQVTRKGGKNMSNNKLKNGTLTALAAGVMAGTANAAESEAVNKLIEKIKDKSDSVRAEAWLSAGEVGAPAVKPLAAVMTDKDLEVARAAKRGLWKIVRHVGRPGAGNEKRAVVAELISLLNDNQPTPVRREVLWMLSEIGRNKSVEAVAALLSNRELREDARMVLQRIPGRKSIAALRAGLKAAPRDFKINIAQSLRQRGVKVRRFPCVKLVPTKKTNVKPVK
ncbi:MAG: HEAT repeat domain-containing protein [Planctomycetota bacterium]|jgi:HEAT repeat protein